MGSGYVGTLTVDLHLPVGGSLKAKRKELLRVKSGLVKRFSCAVAEVDHHDLWQRSRLSLAVVTREASEAGRLVEAASRWLHVGRGVPGRRGGAGRPAGGGGRSAARARAPGCARINTALRAVLSEAIARELSDPRLGMVTITGVAASTDLRTAKVFYTVLETARREASQEALESARGVLQARVGAELHTRNTPQLTFVYDEHQARAVSLTKLIDDARRLAGAALKSTVLSPDVGEVADLLADEGRRFIVASHRNPDGDAIGSVAGAGPGPGARRGATSCSGTTTPTPVPDELAFLLAPGERLGPDLPADAAERTLIALDCASAGRLSERPPDELAGLVVNVDHHHDNTRFGALNLVDGRRLEQRRAGAAACCAPPACPSPARWPSRSTWPWSPTPAGSATPTPRPRRTGRPPS